MIEHRQWITNIYDPKLPDAAQFCVLPMTGETPEQAFQRKLEWLKGKIIGPPFPDTAEMRRNHMVGIYLHAQQS